MADFDARHDTAERFAVFRAASAPAFSEVDVMETKGVTDTIQAGIEAAGAAGADEGQMVKLLFAMPGFSLTYAWFKSGFPLPRHSHDADCLYYIIAGTLRLGTEDLGAGDGFFVGKDVPYAYTPGENGVEVLEFRTAATFDIRFLADNKPYWDKVAATVTERRTAWQGETTPPSGHLIGA